ncbi:MAG: hypothetical protein J7M39_05555 [Anaerolineae bacterium]|nr:hypothetical protein [Anaerolineae bacterium]
MRPGRRIKRAPPASANPAGSAANIGVLLLSAATLMFEITLTRLFSVSQFYHFAFMIVSLALLGFGASGTWLALWPTWGRPPRLSPRLTLAGLALGYGITCLGAYLFINQVPFDSFSIAWDLRQVALLFLHYFILAIPFFCSGAVLSLCFTLRQDAAGTTYAYNLIGSAVGCLLALAIPNLLGGVGPVWLSGALGGIAAVVFVRPSQRTGDGRAWPRRWIILGGLGLAILSVVRAFAVPAGLEPRLSPYKGLSYALQIPEARIVTSAWNGFSRVDLVESPAIRSLPGLSYRFLSSPPPQRGLFVDGDELSPVLDIPHAGLGGPQDADLAFADYMPTAVAYQLRSDGRALVLEPRGGLELWIARGQGIADLTAVAANPLVVLAADHYAGPAPTVVFDDPRSYVRRSGRSYDVVTLALTTPYRPIRSGAYSLGEDYAYTVEAFRDALGVLSRDGILVVSRWLQTPPSESLRAFALAVEATASVDAASAASEGGGGDPVAQIVAFRGYAMMTLLVKSQPFSTDELDVIRDFLDERAFDLVYAPDIRLEDVNRYNVLPSPVYYELFSALLGSDDRAAWYDAYPFDVRPPTDDHPFFGHFFKWSQAGQVIAELGKSWQPFGGAGYFVVVALLALSLAAAALLIGLPLLATSRQARAQAIAGGWGEGRDPRTPCGSTVRRREWWLDLAYFALLGLGYLFVEIPLMQRAILFLGQPARAVTTVLFSLLLFSGVGSALSSKLKVRAPWVLGGLVIMIGVVAVGLPWAFDALLPLPWGLRLAATVMLLAPLGMLMGLPFPLGLSHLSQVAPDRLPWAWAANGAASVVASVLAALLALSVGFAGVLTAGAAVYAVAAMLTTRWSAGG